ncbi:MAG: hypothetical protein QM733_12905 [Ilumatobacteraceae bacterium]
MPATLGPPGPTHPCQVLDAATPSEGPTRAPFCSAGNPLLSALGGRALESVLPLFDLSVSPLAYRAETRAIDASGVDTVQATAGRT